jgi:hypothetical protein
MNTHQFVCTSLRDLSWKGPLKLQEEIVCTDITTIPLFHSGKKLITIDSLYKVSKYTFKVLDPFNPK